VAAAIGTPLAVDTGRGPGALVQHHHLPVWQLYAGSRLKVGCAQEASRNESLGLLVEGDQEWQVGELSGVGLEIRNLTVDVELLQDHVPHGHRQRRVRPR
jgi:hypothetical protein